MTNRPDTDPSTRLVLVTGPSGAGRTTAINALEDMGFEAINNLPLSLVPRLLDGPPIDRPMALGIDARNRDFSTNALIEVIDGLARYPYLGAQVLYLDAHDEVLLRRYSETRRRHPLAPDDSPLEGVAREADLLVPIKARADVLIDTSEMSPHELKAELDALFSSAKTTRLAVTLSSFSYKRGLPRGLDMAFDCRFLRNPYWEPKLRGLNGQDSAVQGFVQADRLYPEFFDKIADLALLLLPAYLEEGKAHLSIGFGCTGGQHRSVTVAEQLSQALADQGWQVSIRHRELERRGAESKTESAAHTADLKGQARLA